MIYIDKCTNLPAVQLTCTTTHIYYNTFSLCVSCLDIRFRLGLSVRRLTTYQTAASDFTATTTRILLEKHIVPWPLTSDNKTETLSKSRVLQQILGILWSSSEITRRPNYISPAPELSSPQLQVEFQNLGQISNGNRRTKFIASEMQDRDDGTS